MQGNKVIKNKNLLVKAIALLINVESSHKGATVKLRFFSVLVLYPFTVLC